jgi:putative hydrolase of the HAD superfamily
MIKAVLFDFGGTLHTSISTEAIALQAAEGVQRILRGNRIILNDPPDIFAEKLAVGHKAYKKYCEISKRELPPYTIWSEWFLKEYDFDREALYGLAEKLANYYVINHVKYTMLPDIPETLKELKIRGIRLGIISNIISRTVVQTTVKDYGIADYFEYIMTSAECGHRKPDPMIFDLALDEMGLRPSECAYVGDTVSRDVIGTRNSGIRYMIKIRNEAKAKKDAEFKDSGYTHDYLIDSPYEIIGIVDEINFNDEGGDK